MNIAINPTVPEYTARITLKPTEPDMKVRTVYKAKPLFSGTIVLLAWAIITVAALV